MCIFCTLLLGVIVIESEKGTSWLCIMLIIAIVVSAVCCLSGKNVHDNGKRADKVRTDIESAGNANQAVQDRLEDSQSGIDDVSSSISRAETAADRIAENLDRAEELNRQCQSIFQRVRQRNEAEAKKD